MIIDIAKLGIALQLLGKSELLTEYFLASEPRKIELRDLFLEILAQ